MYLTLHALDPAGGDASLVLKAQSSTDSKVGCVITNTTLMMRRRRILRLLSGYEPWCGKAGTDNGDPRSRAAILIKEGLKNKLYGTDDELRDDINYILGRGSAIWWRGKVAGRPWQWFTTGARFPLQKETFGYAENNRAILAVEAGQGKYLWMLTALQDAKW